MSETMTIERTPAIARVEPQPSAPRAWYALWTRSHCERLVHDQLAANGFEVFLPEIDIWSRRGGLRHIIRVPVFPGYLFLHRAMDKASYITIAKARGLVGLLGDRWDRLPAIPEPELEAVRRIVGARVPALPYPFLRAGQRVRITSGPLADLEGILVRVNPNRGLLVVSVELLQRSVAVQVDCTSVGPA